MPLNNGHKELIEATISHLFDFGQDQEANQAEMDKIVKALKTDDSESAYAHMSRVFHNPCLIKPIDDYGALTMGEAREGIIEYIRNLLKEQNIVVTWDYEGLLQWTRGMKDHTEALTTKPLAARDWQWTEHENPVTRILAGENAQALVAAGYLTIESAHQLGAYQLSFLVMNAGRRWLENNHYHHTIEAIASSVAGCFECLRRDEGLSPEAASAALDTLNSYQIFAIVKGLRLEQVCSEHFKKPLHALRCLIKLQNTSLSMQDAYAQMEQLSQHQQYGVAIGLSLEAIRAETFGEHTIKGIKALVKKHGTTVSEAGALLHGLQKSQVRGILNGLSRKEVKGSYFLPYYEEIQLLVQDHELSLRDAYAMIQTLFEPDVTAQKEGHGFGATAFKTINTLVSQGSSLGDAYDAVMALDAPQAKGIRMGLNYIQVSVAHFGRHTVQAIKILQGRDEALSLDDAYAKVAEKTKGEVQKLLREEQQEPTESHKRRYREPSGGGRGK